MNIKVMKWIETFVLQLKIVLIVISMTKEEKSVKK